MYDTIIIGAGLLGTSAAYALSEKGQKILLLDSNEKYHALGSSHGNTRITRKLNEHPVLCQTAAASLKTIISLEQSKGDGFIPYQPSIA